MAGSGILVMRGDIHYIVDPSKLLDTLLYGFLQALHIPNINCPEAQHFCSFPSCSYISSHAFCFLEIASHDASVGAEVDECSDLSAADGACAACAEDYFVFCRERMSLEASSRRKKVDFTENAIFPDVAHVVLLG